MSIDVGRDWLTLCLVRLLLLRVGDELLLLRLADSLLCCRLYAALIELDGELLVGESLDWDEYFKFEVLNRKLGVARKSRSVGRPVEKKVKIYEWRNNHTCTKILHINCQIKNYI